MDDIHHRYFDSQKNGRKKIKYKSTKKYHLACYYKIPEIKLVTEIQDFFLFLFKFTQFGNPESFTY